MEKLNLIRVVLFSLPFLLCCHNGDAKGEVDLDMVNKLKESGALDDIKEELEKMLDSKETKDNLPKEEKANEAYTYLKSFLKQKNTNLLDNLVKALADMPTTSDTQAKHFVVLTQLADKLALFINQGQKAMDVETLTNKFVEMTTKFKFLEEFNTAILVNQEAINKAFAGMKESQSSEKSKENVSGVEESEGAKKDAYKNPYKNAITEHLNAETIVQYTQLFVEFLKTNPAMIADYACDALLKHEIASEKIVNLIRTYVKNFAKTDYFINGVQYFGESATTFVTSKGGKQLLELIPTLVNADSRDTITEVLRGQTEVQWESFFNAINNSDRKDAFLEKIASTIEYIYSKILMDDMKMMMANAFLLTQNLPPISPRRLLPSFIDLIGKSLKVFTAMDADITPYEKLAKDLSKHFAEEYVDSNEFAKLKEHERIRLLARFLDENVVVSAQELWRAHVHIFGKAMPVMSLTHKDKTPADIERNLHCAENLLCNINANARKDSSMIRKSTSKGLSLAMSWLWANTGLGLDSMKLYNAVHEGVDIFQSVDCDEKHPVSPPNSCKLFEWQSDKMSLSFDSNELPETTQEKPPKHEEL